MSSPSCGSSNNGVLCLSWSGRNTSSNNGCRKLEAMITESMSSSGVGCEFDEDLQVAAWLVHDDRDENQTVEVVTGHK